MTLKLLIIASLMILIQSQEAENSFNNSIVDHSANITENRLAAIILSVLEHYKQKDPVGFPGSSIPDPMDAPEIKKSFGISKLNMMNVKAYGLSKFRISRVDVDLKTMRVDAGIQLDEVIAKGKYTLNTLFSKANGPFTVTLRNVFIKCTAALVVERSGQLTSERIKMDITFGDMAMDFQNLGFLGSVFQGIINSAPNLVFDTMKPFFLQEADTKIRSEINLNIEKLMGDRRLPNSISPLDMAIAEGRKRVRAMGYDPYRIPNYNRTMGAFSMQLSNTWISGIANFYRVGNIIVSIENNTLAMRVQVGTQQVAGAGQWEIGCGLLSRAGHVQFSVQYIQVTFNISQTLDTRRCPQINDLQIVLGNIQVRCDGAGTFDYIMEFVINVLPNLLRYQIMDALENPIKVRIQEKFNTIDVEKAIKNNLKKFQEMGQELSFDFQI